MYDKVPPQALDVEKTVLGSMLIDEDARDTGLENLREDSFYSTAHREIFRSILSLVNHDAAIDLVTIAEELRKNEKLEKVGGEAYLSELSENIATSANIEYHTKILNDKATLRNLISVSANITTEAFTPDADAKGVVDRAEASIFSIAEKNIKNKPTAIKSILHDTFGYLQKMSKRGGPTGVQSGFTKLDEMTTGFHAGDLVIVAARPGMGKTSFALSLALNAAVNTDEQLAIALFSLEMTKMQIVMRMLSAEAGIDMKRLRSGRLTAREMAKLGEAAGPLGKAPVFIDDTPGITVTELRAKCRRIKAQEGLGLIVVDYLQLMRGVERSQSREQEISQISRSLKEIAKELEVPLIALSQLSRAPEQRTGDHRPQLSDLRESGAIEQDADLVLFIFREAIYKKDDDSFKGIAEIIIGKQRNGPTGIVKLSFMEELANFGNLDFEHMEEEEEAF